MRHPTHICECFSVVTFFIGNYVCDVVKFTTRTPLHVDCRSPMSGLQMCSVRYFTSKSQSRVAVWYRAK
jgi:hypothetical protein